jgi:hypothetical protein
MKRKPSVRRGVATKRTSSGLRRSERPAAVVPAEATLGILVGLGPAGEAWVDVPKDRRRNVPARTTVALIPEYVSREVLLTWVDDDREHPVITGVIRKPVDAERESASPRLEAIVDAERIVLTGQREVVLRCGKASLLLAADGSVVIKGVKLLTSATGVHRIRGGAVQIN